MADGFGGMTASPWGAGHSYHIVARSGIGETGPERIGVRNASAPDYCRTAVGGSEWSGLRAGGRTVQAIPFGSDAGPRGFNSGRSVLAASTNGTAAQTGGGAGAPRATTNTVEPRRCRHCSLPG